jgi:hypothetical protein
MFVMKKIIILLLFIAAQKIMLAQNVGIGTTTPNPSAQLDVASTTKGMLIPRMTDAEKNAIPTPLQGLLVFNITTNSFQYFNGVSWINISHSGIINGTSNKVAKFNSPWGLTANTLITDNGVGVAINTTNALPNGSALLDITSTNKGLLIPRMTSAERNAIASPIKGLIVYDSTTNNFSFYNGTAWTDLNSSGGNWSILGNNIYNSNTGNVGIGASTPSAKLTVNGDALIASGLSVGTTNRAAKLDVTGAGTTSATNTLLLRNSLGDTLLRMRDDGRMGIGYNSSSYGRLLNLGGTGINFYNANETTFGGAIFPTDTSLVLWSDSGPSDYLILQPSWGNTGIGTYSPNAKLHLNGRMLIGGNSILPATNYELSVDGEVIAEGFTTMNSNSWPDYVFEKNYALMPLAKLKEYIKTNKHLPNVPDAATLEKKGINLGEMTKKLTEKIEELTLYIIKFDEKNVELVKQLERQKKSHQKQIDDLKAVVNKLIQGGSLARQLTEK